jgi:hypothetical protein
MDEGVLQCIRRIRDTVTAHVVGISTTADRGSPWNTAYVAVVAEGSSPLGKWLSLFSGSGCA